MRFPPTDVGAQSEARVVLTNPGESAVSVALDVSPPFAVDERSLDLAPGASQRLVVRFSPAAEGKAEGAIRFTSGPLTWALPVEGEGRALDCPAAPCHVATRDASGQCVVELAPNGTSCRTACVTTGGCREGRCEGQARQCNDGDPCTEDDCDPLAGCTARPMAEGASCGIASCEASPVCRAGQCVEEPERKPDPNACGLDRVEVERAADPRRVEARLFVRDTGALDVVAPGLLERREPSGSWRDDSASLSGFTFLHVTPSGPDTFWFANDYPQYDVFRGGFRQPPQLAFVSEDGVSELLVGDEHGVWFSDYFALHRWDTGALRSTWMTEHYLQSYVVCGTEQWELDFDYTQEQSLGRVGESSGNLEAGACANGRFVGLRFGRLVVWGPEGWTPISPPVPVTWKSGSKRWALPMRAKALDDVWLDTQDEGRLHWNGVRWTRLPFSPRTWEPVAPGEGWSIEEDGSLVHRRQK